MLRKTINFVTFLGNTSSLICRVLTQLAVVTSESRGTVTRVAVDSVCADSIIQAWIRDTIIDIWMETKIHLLNCCPVLFNKIHIYKYHVINHKGNWLGTFLDKFGWTKKNLLDRDLNLRPPDWRAGDLPTELTSPILAVSLFCQYLCSGGASQKSWNHILPFSQGSRPSYDTTWEEAVRRCTIKEYNVFLFFSINII